MRVIQDSLANNIIRYVFSLPRAGPSSTVLPMTDGAAVAATGVDNIETRSTTTLN